MGSVSLAPLHGSTGAAVHINQPNRSFYVHKHASKTKTDGSRVRERTVARAVLCKQTGVNLEAYCLYSVHMLKATAFSTLNWSLHLR